jgi:membrane protein DedA with SNARE-associated domain
MEHLLSEAGYAALAILGFLEACCVPIPSEVTFLFGGVLAFRGDLNVVLVIVVGTLAELCGSYVSYYVGRLGGRPLVERVGKYLLITRTDIDRVERFFTGRGEWTVAVGRVIPLLRAFTPLVAGFAEVPPVTFGILSLIGTAVYATILVWIGYAAGSAWDKVSHYLAVGSYVIAAVIVVGVAVFIAHRLRELRKEAAEQRAEAGSEAGTGTPVR